MKIECTAEEFHVLSNVARLEQVKEYLEVAKSDHDLAVKELEDEKQILREKLEQVESQLSAEKWNNIIPSPDLTGKLARLIKASALYFAHKSIPNADALRKALEDFYPNQGIPQIKILREVANCGLKEAKDFVDGTASWIPSPASDNDSSDDIPF